MEDLAVNSISYGGYWFLVGVVPVMFSLSVLFHTIVWEAWREDWLGTWEPRGPRLPGFEPGKPPNLLIWFAWHVVVVAVVVPLALYSPASNLWGTALFAVELWAVPLVVLALLMVRDGLPRRMAAAHAGLWLLRLEVVLYVVGRAMFSSFTNQW
ncbi:hypothetical protein ACFROC_38485 [Nocardia tengchongensis]|uniref:hypothetical protein n=1 Tax=Nocardia tengchongensis TaxID=2055889 RepID=UPI0036BBFCB5